MGELSPEQAAVGIYKDYITTPPSYADRKAVGLGKQQYTAITKPAALTGELYVSIAQGIVLNPSYNLKGKCCLTDERSEKACNVVTRVLGLHLAAVPWNLLRLWVE